MAKKIILSKGPNSWVAAHFIDGKPEATLVYAFGTHILPTAFMPAAAAQDVVRAIQILNPTVVVEVESA